MGKQRGLAQRIVSYMVDYDNTALNDWADGTAAILDAYDETMAQLNSSDGWMHVAWYLITQLQPTEGMRELEAYDMLEELFAYHGIG